MSNILIIKSASNSFECFYNEAFKKRNIDVWTYEDICENKPVSPITFFKLGIEKKWRKRLKKYNAIIVFDYFGLSILPALYIFKSHSCKLAVWEWNTVGHQINSVISHLASIYTFDLNEAHSYGWNYINQFYPEDESNKSEENINTFNNSVKPKAFFVGVDKDRKKYLEQLKAGLNQNNIICDFFVIGGGSATEGQKYLEYSDVLEHIHNSTFLIDVVKENQVGLTVRTLEGIFNDKKIITNNRFIKNMSFYDESRALILEEIDEKTPSKIKSFIRIPLKKYTEKETYPYSLSNWIKEITR